jgi:hypothetical protein
MPEAAFVLSPRQDASLRELAEILGHELGMQAVTSSLHLGGFPEPRPDRVYVLVDPGGYVAAEGESALPDDAIMARTIMLCAESPPADSRDPRLDVLHRAGSVFAIDQRAAVALSRLGIRARLVRPGYTPVHDRFDPDRDRPLDVVFLGAHSLRRTRYLNHAARVLARLNCRVHIAAGERAAIETASSTADGRRSLLAQAKVVINLHRGEDTRLEWRSVLDAIHAGAVVVTEHSSGLAPLVAGEHVLVASAESLPFVAENLLRDPERLAALRTAAYERLSKWVPFALPVAVLRAAIVELVGEPVPRGASLGAARSGGPPGVAMAQRDGDAPAPAASAPAAPAPEGTRGVAPEGPTPAIAVVSVLGSAGDDGRLIATLDSVAGGSGRGVELILVADDGDEPAGVPAWLDAHPQAAARRVAVEAGTSLGAARNAGVAVTEAALCLLLDPGMELYPRCLGTLRDAMARDPDAAFAYCIQEVTGDADRFAEAGGDYLLSFVAWDADRIRGGNYIHAPALIRTDVLNAVGGFATGDELRGSEDHDLWCRIAERGGRGVLVPQVLARRPGPNTFAPSQ